MTPPFRVALIGCGWAVLAAYRSMELEGEIVKLSAISFQPRLKAGR